MASNNIIKNTLTLYVRMLISMFLGFFTSRILLKQLGVTDFGLYNVVAGFIMMLAFLNSALSLGTQRFLNYALGKGEEENLQKIFLASLTIHVSFALLILIIAETGGLYFLNNYMTIPSNRLMATNIVYQFVVFSSSLAFIQIPYLATLIAYEKMQQYATICIIDVILKFFAAFVLFFISEDKLICYSFAIFIAAIVVFILYVLYCHRNFLWIKYTWPKDKKMLKSMLSFSGWNVFSSISIILNGQVVNVLLNIFFGPTVNAARGISTQLNNSISGLVNNFQIAVNPQIVQSYSSGDKITFYNLINKSAKFSYFLLLIFIIPICLNIKEVLIFWLGSIPFYSDIFCIIIFLTTLFNSFSLPLATAANADGNIKKFQCYTGLAELSSIPLSYLFLKLGFSPVVVFIIAFCIVVTTLFIRLAVLKDMVHLDVLSFIVKIVVRCIGCSVLAGAIGFFISKNICIDGYIGLFVRLGIDFMLTILVIYITGLNSSEKDYFKNMIIKKFKVKRI